MSGLILGVLDGKEWINHQLDAAGHSFAKKRDTQSHRQENFELVVEADIKLAFDHDVIEIPAGVVLCAWRRFTVTQSTVATFFWPDRQKQVSVYGDGRVVTRNLTARFH